MALITCYVFSVNLRDFPEVLVLAREYPHVFASVGVHPNEQGTEEPTTERLVELGADPLIVAIGETGLDYFRSTGDLTWQHERFKTHIHAAIELGKATHYSFA